MKTGWMMYALAQLSERERGLLLVLGAVVVPVAVVFLAVLPMMQARDTARLAAAEADAMLNWVAAQVRLMPAEGAGAPVKFGTDAEPIGLSGIEESLVRADLRDFVTGLANRSAGGVDLSLDAAPFDLLGNWLQAMSPYWGYRILSFRIDTASPGLVNAAFELEPRP